MTKMTLAEQVAKERLAETIYYKNGVPGTLCASSRDNPDSVLWKPRLDWLRLKDLDHRDPEVKSRWCSKTRDLTIEAPEGMETRHPVTGLYTTPKEAAEPAAQSVTQSAAQPLDRNRDKTWNPDTDPAPAPPDQRVKFDTAARAVVVEAAGGARWDMAAGRYLIRCESCGVDFHSARPHTRSCSPKCRKALSRK